jgi:predicted nucleotidyltransferase
MISSPKQTAFESYAETARTRAQARLERLEARRLRGLALAQRAALRLCGDFGARRAAVFGSVLKPRLFHERSDVDLAVWGLDERLYLRALSALLDLEPDIAVDLVEVEQARPELQRVIERDGVAL